MHFETLPNGLKILLAPSNAESAFIAIGITHGLRSEPPELSGISHLLEHLFFESSGKFKSRLAKDRYVDQMGGELNGFTSHDLICAHLSFDPSKTNQALNLIFDSVIRPRFNRAIIEKEKRVLQIEEAGAFDDNDHVLDAVIRQSMFPGTGLEHAFEATDGIRLWHLKRYHKKVIRPNRIIVVATGNIDKEKIRQRIINEFDSINPGYEKANTPFVLTQKKSRTTFIPAHEKSFHCILSFPTFGYDDPRRYAMTVLNNIIGGRNSSLLYGRLRRMGLVYDSMSHIWHWPDTGYFQVCASCRNNKSQRDRNRLFEIIEQIISILRKTKQELISKEELILAKDNLTAKTNQLFDDLEYEAKFYLGQITQIGKPISQKEFLRDLNQVNRVSLRTLAQQFFVREHLNLAVLGDSLSTKDKKNIISLYSNL